MTSLCWDSAIPHFLPYFLPLLSWVAVGRTCRSWKLSASSGHIATLLTALIFLIDVKYIISNPDHFHKIAHSFLCVQKYSKYAKVPAQNFASPGIDLNVASPFPVHSQSTPPWTLTLSFTTRNSCIQIYFPTMPPYCVLSGACSPQLLPSHHPMFSWSHLPFKKMYCVMVQFCPLLPDPKVPLLWLAFHL